MQAQVRFETLAREESLRLIAANHFGRLALNLRSEVPMVRPVNYLFDERSQSIVFRTDFGAKFRGIIVASRATFEVDDVDPVRHTGWSVIATGSVERVTNYHELERFRQAGLETWAPGEKPHWARIRVSVVSGRRVVA